MRNTIFFVLFISMAMAIFFLAYPEIDPFFSSLFYDMGQGFFLRHHPFLTTIYHGVRYTTVILALSYILLLILHFTRPHLLPAWLSRARILYLLLALALGPGLVVNTVFKDQWGRARPLQTEQFGGDKHFSPAFILTDQCEKNCSFVSGHAAVGYYLYAFAFAFPLYRRLFIMLGTLGGLGLGLARIMQGSHFLSDVMFSGVFVYFSCYLLYQLFVLLKFFPSTKDTLILKPLKYKKG